MTFDASNLWEKVEVNTVGAIIIWGSLFENYNTAQALQSIRCPIFLALGRHDFFNPPYLWEGYHHYALDFTRCIFEKSGHTPQLEELDKFDEALLIWLEQK